MLDKYSYFILTFLDLDVIQNLSNEKKQIIKNERNFLLKHHRSLIKKSSENRIAFYFIKKIEEKHLDIFKELKLGEILLTGTKKWNKILKTRKYLSNFSRNLNFILFKSAYDFPTISSDIDILFFDEIDFNNFIKLTKKDNFNYVQDEKFKGSLYKENYLKIEPHLDISWCDRQFIDKDFIFKNYILKKMGNIEINTPNEASALLISLAHILFDCQYLSLRDFVEIKKVIKNESIIKEIRMQSVKYGWEKAFDYLVKFIRNIIADMEKNSRKTEYRFPIWIPFTLYVKFLISKIIFDRNNGKGSLNIRNILFSLVPYFWKRTRMKFSKKVYRHSWLY